MLKLFSSGPPFSSPRLYKNILYILDFCNYFLFVNHYLTGQNQVNYYLIEIDNIQIQMKYNIHIQRNVIFTEHINTRISSQK